MIDWKALTIYMGLGWFTITIIVIATGAAFIVYRLLRKERRWYIGRIARLEGDVADSLSKIKNGNEVRRFLREKCTELQMKLNTAETDLDICRDKMGKIQDLANEARGQFEIYITEIKGKEITIEQLTKRAFENQDVIARLLQDINELKGNRLNCDSSDSCDGHEKKIKKMFYPHTAAGVAVLKDRSEE